jgi:hypothetical protein
MDLFEWFKVFVYILLWVFTWTLIDSIAVEYNLSNKDIIKLCLIGLFTIIILIQNSKINIS